MGADRELPAWRARAGGLLSARRVSAPRRALSTRATAMLAVALLLGAAALTLALSQAGKGHSARTAVSPSARGSARSAGRALASRRASGHWTQPARLSDCPASGAAHAAFPRDSPSHATGRGAIVWSAAASCAGGAGTLVSLIGADDSPTAPADALSPSGRRLVLREPLAVAPAPHGLLAIAGSASSPTAADGLLVQGPAAGPFSTLGSIAGSASPGTLSTGYLGDLAAVTPTGGDSDRGGARVDIERYFARRLSPSRVVQARSEVVEAPTVSLDYRTDAIVVWRQAGALYVHHLAASGRDEATQRLASVAPAPRVTALVSDDNRAIVAWADERNGTTSVYLDRSSSGVRFGRPQLLERFADPAGLPSPAASPRLVRLSTESVMLAWSGAQDGHWVVRTAAIDFNGIGPFRTVSDPRSEALLNDLQPGPRGEAIALWTEPQPAAGGRPSLAHQAVVAARGADGHPDATYFGDPEPISPPGPNSDATIALDPASDRAVALWRGEGGAIEYAIRTPIGH